MPLGERTLRTRSAIWRLLFCLRRWCRENGAAAAPVLPFGPGQEVLVDEIPAQRGEVVVQGRQELADLALWVAHPWLKGLSDHVKQQAPFRLPGRDRLDLAVTQERAQLRIASHSLEDWCRVKIGHDYIVG
jgi:hypothetical protein